MGDKVGENPANETSKSNEMNMNITFEWMDEYEFEWIRMNEYKSNNE